MSDTLTNRVEKWRGESCILLDELIEGLKDGPKGENALECGIAIYAVNDVGLKMNTFRQMIVDIGKMDEEDAD